MALLETARARLGALLMAALLQFLPGCDRVDDGRANQGKDYGSECGAYGPRPCTTDQDCRDWYDAGYLKCDTTYSYGGCPDGKKIVWPTCVDENGNPVL